MRLLAVFFCSTLVSVISTERNFVLTAEDSSVVLNGYSIAQNYSKEITVSSTCPNCVIQINGGFSQFAQLSFTAGAQQYSTADFRNNQLQLVGPIAVKSQGDPDFILAFTIANGSALVVPNLQNYQIQRRSPDTEVKLTINSSNPAVTIVQPIDMAGLSIFLSNVRVSEDCSVHVYSGGVPGKAGADKYLITSVSFENQLNWHGSSLPVSAVTFVVDQGCTGIAFIKPITDVSVSQDSVMIDSMGVIMSREYPGVFDSGMMGDQMQKRIYSTTGRIVNFNIEVVAADAGAGGSLNMSVKGYKKQVWEEMFTTNVGDSNQKWIGQKFGVEWRPGQAPRKGFLIRYHVTDESSSTVLFTSLILPLLLLFVGKY